MLLEVIATCVQDAIAAEQAGADRIELITGILEGGLTPSAGLIAGVIQAVSIPVNIMVRPHSRSFHYDAYDQETMGFDIRMIRSLGAAGIVIGALTQEGQVDTDALRTLLAEAGSLDVTFHRAFDEVPNRLSALATLSQFPQISRILTSGGQPSVLHAIPEIRRLVQAASQTHLRILAGSGLTVEALPSFLQETGVTEVHFGSGVRVGGLSLNPIEVDRIAAIRSRIVH